MITISEYLGYLFGQVTQARAIADAETLRVAEIYAKDELLKHFSVPRFRIPELELNIPMSIGKAEYASSQEGGFKKEEFQKKYATTLNQALLTLGSKLSFDNVAFESSWKLISQLYDELITKPAEGEKLITAFHSKIFENSISLARIEKIQKETYWKLKETTQKEILEHYFDLQNSIKRSTLATILINPETTIIKNEANEISVFQIKAKFVEEGVYINSIKDENGKEKKVLNFE